MQVIKGLLGLGPYGRTVTSLEVSKDANGITIIQRCGDHRTRPFLLSALCGGGNGRLHNLHTGGSMPSTKPRITPAIPVVRELYPEFVWRCAAPDTPTSFGPTPKEAYYSWQRRNQ